MAPPTLPQELIDKIIDQFGETARMNTNQISNKRTLASLSMVAKAWRKRSQKHLFSVIDFRAFSSVGPTTEADLDAWGPAFSLTRDLNIDGYWEAFSQFNPVAISSLRYFRHVESLSLTGWYFRWLSADQLSACFSHLGETLNHLKLEGTASSESLIYLTSMFPRLRLLEIIIAAVLDEDDARRISNLPTTGSFQGYLHLWGLSKAHNAFLAFLSSTSPRFETICIDSCQTGDGTWKLINSSATSLESLELHKVDEDDLRANPKSLSECTELREVSISHPYSESTPALLQTIRSPHLKKFAISFGLWPQRGSINDGNIEEWRKADNELRAAHDQWAKHVTGKIEATFCIPGDGGSGCRLEGYQRDVKMLFPRFTENVAVTTVC